MTIREYVSQKLRAFDLTEATLADVSAELGMSLEEEYTFDIATYKKSLFGMFSGETTAVTIEAHRTLIDAIFDLFGEKTRIISNGEETVRFTVDVQVSPLFFGWCCSFGEKVKLLGPDNIIEQLKEYTDSVKEQYEK